MTSWRDSDDPRCPACGEKITATASYCMHCEADFDEDGSVVPNSEGETHDDFSHAGGTAGGKATDAGTGSDWDTADDGTDPTSGNDVDLDAPDGPDRPPDVGQSTSADVGQSTSADVGSGTGPSVGRDSGADSVEETTLLLRGPVCVIMGFPAGIMVLIAMALAFGDLSGSLAVLGFLAGWIGVTGYLLRKPLASDAIGDGFYVYAGLLLVLPILLSLGMVVRSLLGLSDDSIPGAIFAGIAFEFTFLFPALVFLAIGYGANYYARQKIEAALDERGRTA